MIQKELKFDRKRSRVKYCPCNKKNTDGKFVPYMGYENKGYCHSCGETFLPELDRKEYKRELHFEKPKLTSYHNNNLVMQSGRNFNNNNFVRFLKTLFSVDKVNKAVLMYHIGTSKHWPGANIFWQIDNAQNARHGKIMLYNSGTGKRKKNVNGKAYINSVRSTLKLKDFNLKQCLFGQHLINEKVTRNIGLVESEKTAVIMSIFKPELLWLATGSKQGFKYEMLKPIRQFNIIAFPDKGEYYEWLNSALELNRVGFNITVNSWIETQTECLKGADLADIYINSINNNAKES